jgi:hypothetical protein
VRPQPEVRVKRIEISQGGVPSGVPGGVPSAPVGSVGQPLHGQGLHNQDGARPAVQGKVGNGGEIARPSRAPRVVRSVTIED